MKGINNILKGRTFNNLIAISKEYFRMKENDGIWSNPRLTEELVKEINVEFLDKERVSAIVREELLKRYLKKSKGGLYE